MMVKKKNQKIEIDGEVCRIFAKGDHCILFDLQDIETLSKCCWSIDKRKTNTYAITNSLGKSVRMHRLLIDCGHKGSSVVDHINGNGLDNRRCNLRAVDVSLNCLNQFSIQGESKYRGVCKCRSKLNPWRAQVCVRGSKVYLGSFATEESAAAAYNAAVRAMVNDSVNENNVPDIAIKNARWQGKFKGVRKENGRFFAVVWAGGRMVRVGTFATPIEAAVAYDSYVENNFPGQKATNASLGLRDETSEPRR
jgi:hypothetical protein